MLPSLLQRVQLLEITIIQQLQTMAEVMRTSQENQQDLSAALQRAEHQCRGEQASSSQRMASIVAVQQAAMERQRQTYDLY